MSRRMFSFWLVVLALLGATQAMASVAAWWPFDGTANDWSGNGHNGTLHGGVAYDVARCDSGISLDGTSGYVEVPDGAGLDGMVALTLQAWIYLHAYPPVSDRGVNIVNKWGAGGPIDDSYQLGLTDRDQDGDADHLYLEVSDGNPSDLPDDDYISLRFSEASIPLDQWVHVSATFAPGSDPIHLYINCASSDGPYYTGTDQQTQFVQNTDAPLLMGINEVSQFLNMILDQVVVYDAVVAPDCTCESTPVTPTSWGGVKALYR